MTKRSSTLDQAVLGEPGTQLGGDQLACPSPARDHPHVAEEQRAVLQAQASPKLLLVDERASRRAKAVRRREILIRVAVQSSGKTLEDDWRRRQRELDESGGASRRQRRDEAIDRGLALLLEMAKRLRALDERGALLQAQDDRDLDVGVHLSQAAVRVGGAQSGLDQRLAAAWATHGEPCLSRLEIARVMHLERNRRLAPEKAPPPTGQNPLVQRL